MALWTYSPQDVDVILGGIFKAEGFIDGTFVQVQKSSDLSTFRESTDGVVTRTPIKSNTYKIQLTLAQSSPTNTILSTVVEIDALTQMGHFPIIIKDNTGSSLFYSPCAWITKLPELTFSAGIEARTWELVAINGSMNIGDNSGTSDDTVSNVFQAIAAAAPTIGALL